MAEGVEPDTPELYIFARFHARPGLETEVAETLRDVIAATRHEPGCAGIQAFEQQRAAHHQHRRQRGDVQETTNRRCFGGGLRKAQQIPARPVRADAGNQHGAGGE